MMKHKGSKLKLSRLLPNIGSTFTDIKVWYNPAKIDMQSRFNFILAIANGLDRQTNFFTWR